MMQQKDTAGRYDQLDHAKVYRSWQIFTQISH